MPRSRSAIIRKANPGWHGLTRIDAQTYRNEPAVARRFYEENLQKAVRLEIELGSGAGSFLLEAARKHPETQFLGIEYAGKFVRLIRDRVEKLELKNALVLATDGQAFIRESLPAESVDVFHVYFPDPWPKRSQQKRRALSPEGQKAFHRVLKKSGKLYFTTDHEGYADAVRESIAELSLFTIESEQIIHGSTLKPEEFSCAAYGLRTHFGAKYFKVGKPIHAFCFQKR